MQLELAGKLVLITGGSKGIGFACAEKFLAEGARVIICARAPEAALARLPGAIGLAADLTDAPAAAAMVAQAEAHGPIDILVNSAGAARRTPPAELTPAAWHAAMGAKFFTYIHVIDPLVKLMAARGAGVIVNVIGQGGKIASKVHLAGGAANAALMLATAGLGHAYAEAGVRIVGINPTGTDTERIHESLSASARMAGVSVEAARADMLAGIPIGRLASPAEVADFVLFLASARASYISGVNLGIDGGLTPIVV